jgi:hypothetical protein
MARIAEGQGSLTVHSGTSCHELANAKIKGNARGIIRIKYFLTFSCDIFIVVGRVRFEIGEGFLMG